MSETIDKQLNHLWARLVIPPADVNELLKVLDGAQSLLSWVMKPSGSMEDAVCRMKEALVADDLMCHSDIDVRVAVAFCFSEVIRISATVSPYDDEQMKKIFWLIVDAFEGLSDTSSRSYYKRVKILATMAKVKSCVKMLDLHCDAMILEMFQHFLKSIRDYHPDCVFSDMETIMTLVLEESVSKESDHVSGELLSPLLDSLEIDDKNVLPIRQKLAKKVIENCVAKLKPDMIHHRLAVATQCNGAKANASGEHPANESKSLGKSGLKETGSGLLGLAADWSSQSGMSNNDAQIGNGDSLSPRFPQKKPGYTRHSHNFNQAESTDKALKMVVKPEIQPVQATLKTRDSALAWVEAKERLALIEAWEKISKKKAACNPLENLYGFESWENGKKTAFKAKLKRIEEKLEKKAECVGEMKIEVALIHKETEEKRAMIQAKHEEILKAAEEIASKYQGVEKMKTEVAFIHKEVEEMQAMIQAKHEEILKAVEEIASNNQGVEKMKTEMVLIHKEAEEKQAMIQAKHEEILKAAEEIVAKYRLPLHLLFAYGGLLIWLSLFFVWLAK